MPQELTDQQLGYAIWLYEHRTQFFKLLYFFTIGITSISAIVFLVMFVSFMLSIGPHKTELLQYTQNAVLFQDPVVVVRPKELRVKSINIIPHKKGKTDLLAIVENPNTKWSGLNFEYTFVVDGRSLDKQSSFALPGINHLVAFVDTEDDISKVDLLLENVRWQRIKSPVDTERLSLLHFNIKDAKIVPGKDKDIIDTISAVITNKTPFDFWQVDFIAVMTKNKKIIAVGKASIAEFLSEQESLFQAGVGFLNTYSVDDIQIIPRVNILDDNVII